MTVIILNDTIFSVNAFYKGCLNVKKYFFSFVIFFSFSNNNLIDSYSIKEISKRKSWPVILPITAALVTDYIMSKITSEKPSEEKTEKKSLDKKICCRSSK